MQLLTPDQLKRYDTKRLYYLFKYVRAWVSGMNNYDEFDGTTIQEVPVKPYEDYLERIKKELQSRPFVSFTKEARAERQQEKIAGLRGNRRQRNRQQRKAASFKFSFAGWIDSLGSK